MAGSGVGYSIPSYLYSKSSCAEEWAHVYAMKANGNFPESSPVNVAMDFYFQANSLQMTCPQAAAYAASLANDGVCPLTSKSSSSPAIPAVDKVMSTLKELGPVSMPQKVPAIMGSSGVGLLVIPHVCGCAVFLPQSGSPTASSTSVCSGLGVDLLKTLAQKFKL